MKEKINLCVPARGFGSLYLCGANFSHRSDVESDCDFYCACTSWDANGKKELKCIHKIDAACLSVKAQAEADVCCAIDDI